MGGDRDEHRPDYAAELVALAEQRFGPVGSAGIMPGGLVGDLNADLHVMSQSTLIEFGAGTGQFTVEAAQACARVVAVDVSPPMLAYLEKKLSDQNLTNVTLVNAGFLSYTQPGSQANFVYSRYGLDHLPDFWKAIALDRMRKLLFPGGICRLWDVVYDFNSAEATERIEAWCSQGGASVDGEWSRDEFEEHIRDEHSTFRWLLEPMMQRAGFDIADVQYAAETFDAKYVLRAT